MRTRYGWARSTGCRVFYDQHRDDVVRAMLASDDAPRVAVQRVDACEDYPEVRARIVSSSRVAVADTPHKPGSAWSTSYRRTGSSWGRRE